MGIDYQDWKGLQAKKAPQAPEVIVRTIESSEAWNVLEGWVKDQILAAEAEEAMLVVRYKQDPLGNYESMARQKSLLDITQSAVLDYRRVLDRMHQIHPRET